MLSSVIIVSPPFLGFHRTYGPWEQDLVFIEESFERLLLDYDRVFSAMGIPACLWRRTGEVYKGNREFASLIGVQVEDLLEVSLS